ncbi:MAG: N-acetylmuramoyl-L-alanine amidase [Chryseolinea sp.]
MKTIGKFTLLEDNEFESWLDDQEVSRKIKLIQLHHTFIPSYKHFKNNNYFRLCRGMEDAHLERGFAEIAQNFTTFPDGKIMVCRKMNKAPAGIRGANGFGICIENLGNFDIGKDIMTALQGATIVLVTRALLKHFSLSASDSSVVYHHWYDLNTGRRILKDGTGTTKTCPGTGFYTGNTVDHFNNSFLPLLAEDKVARIV